MFHRLKSVQALPNMVLQVEFLTGEVKLFDVKPLISKWGIFKDLTQEEGLFDLVRVDTGGYGIVWNENIDLACNDLWEGANLP